MFAKLLENKVTIGDWCFANVSYQVVVKVLHNQSKAKLGLETRHIIYFVVKGIHRKTKPSSQLTCIEQLSADLHVDCRTGVSHVLIKLTFSKILLFNLLTELEGKLLFNNTNTFVHT